MKVSESSSFTATALALLLNAATTCQGFTTPQLSSTHHPSRSSNHLVLLHVASTSSSVTTTMPQLFFATAIAPPSVLGEASDMSLAQEIDELHTLLHEFDHNEMDDAYQRAQAALAELEAIQEAIQRDVEMTSMYEQEASVYENGSSYDFDMDMVDELYASPTSSSSWEDLQHNPQMYQGHELEESSVWVSPPRFDFDNDNAMTTTMTPRPPLPQTLSRKRLEELKRRYDSDNALLP